jgi:hypothetical protein
MKRSHVLRSALALLALLFGVTTAMAQETAAKERKPSKETLAKYDANKDGVLDEAEKAAAKAGAAAKAKETREANLAKYDGNKDGKLDDAEKAARKADEEAAKSARKAEREAKKEGKAETKN